jgi:hypothetical protein
LKSGQYLHCDMYQIPSVLHLNSLLKLQDVKTSACFNTLDWIEIILFLGLAEAALGEGTGAKLQKLSVKDIKYVSFWLDTHWINIYGKFLS